MAVTSKKSAVAYDSYLENKKKKPGSFTYSVKKPEFTYDSKDVNKYYDELLNRKDFSFDLNGSALYNQYKDQYVKQGQLAMMDTIGQASAMTGGYGNSYAASAGQQAYQQNLDKLNEVVPEIYQLAMEQYQLEGQNLMDKYGVAASERDTAYGMYRDEKADWYTDKEFAYGQHRDEVADWQYEDEQLYGRYADQRDYERQVERDKVEDDHWQKGFDFQVERANVQDNQWQQELDYQKGRDAVKDDQWQQDHNEQVRVNNHNMYIDNENLKENKRINDHNIYIDNENLKENKRVNDHNMYIDNENLKIDKSNSAHNQYMDKAYLEEEKANNAYNRTKDGKTEDGGMSQEDIMGWLSDYGLLTEENIVKALTDFDSFIAEITSGNTTTQSQGKSQQDYDALSEKDQTMVDYLAGQINKKGIANDPEAIEALFDDLERSGALTSEQRETYEEFFIN